MKSSRKPTKRRKRRGKVSKDSIADAKKYKAKYKLARKSGGTTYKIHTGSKKVAHIFSNNW